MAAEVALQGLSLIQIGASVVASLLAPAGPLVSPSVPADLCVVFVLSSLSATTAPFHLLTRLPV